VDVLLDEPLGDMPTSTSKPPKSYKTHPLNRKALGAIIFPDPAKRAKLNKIVHPAVRWKMFTEVVKYWMRGERWCVLDVPLLIEGGVWRFVAEVALVSWWVSHCLSFIPKVHLFALVVPGKSSYHD